MESSGHLEELELELLSRVLVEDSQWLDTFQSSILRKIDDGKPCRITLLTDEENSNASPDQQKEQRLVQSCSMSGHSYGTSAPSCRLHCPYSTESLPASEFISGSKSLVTSESLRLLKRAVADSTARSFSVRQNIHFKAPR